ncbi:MAG: hypothetical protein M1823_000819 [Watsoniomyces obsoletus]|nr:MAG: hypothetical protein M1823_000819 [Watsoniomyces obsoletus]
MVAAIPFDPPVSEGVKNAPALRKLEARQLGVLDRMFSLAGRDRSQRREGVLWLKTIPGNVGGITATRRNAVQDMVQKSYPDNTYLACYATKCKRDRNNPSKCQQDPRIVEYVPSDGVNYPYCKEVSPTQGRQNPSSTNNRKGLQRREVKLSTGALRNIAGGARRNLKKLSYADNTHLACYSKECIRDPNDARKCRLDPGIMEYVGGDGVTPPYCKFPAPLQKREDPNTTDKGKRLQRRQVKPTLGDRWNNAGRALGNINKLSYPDDKAKGCYQIGCQRDRNNPGRCRAFSGILEYVPSKGGRSSYCKEVPPLTLHRDGSVTGGGTEQNR